MTDDDRGLEHEPAIRFFCEAVTYRIPDLSVITGLLAVWGNTENINSVRSRMAAPRK
ncbi:MULTISPECIES: hypothetical protein [unclassified Microcoleus]|uniref:hypothetical protein n=1 Tax=unclassified Microcoleus TaxID=2642155 RepID=UPI002FD2CE52